MGVFQELALEARAVNAANGWGLTFGQNGDQEIPGYLALIHSEIVEAQTASSDSAAVRELGDVIVRCLDLCELVVPGVVAQFEARGEWTTDRPWVWQDKLLSFHAQTTAALEAYRKLTPYDIPLTQSLMSLAADVWGTIPLVGRGGDPEVVVREILAANRQRPYRHGNRRT